MKTILVPSPVTLTDRNTGAIGETITFKQWAFLSWFTDPRWGNPQTNLAKMVKVIDAIEVGGEKLCLEDADYELFLQIVREPQGPQQPPLIRMQFAAFVRAVETAT